MNSNRNFLFVVVVVIVVVVFNNQIVIAKICHTKFKFLIAIRPFSDIRVLNTFPSLPTEYHLYG